MLLANSNGSSTFIGKGGRQIPKCWTVAVSRTGRAFLISGSVGARAPPLRGSGPLD